MGKVSGKTKFAKFMAILINHLQKCGRLEYVPRNCQRIAEELGDEYGDYVVFENPRPIKICNGWFVRQFNFKWYITDDGDNMSEVYMRLISPSGKNVYLYYVVNTLTNEMSTVNVDGPEAEIKFLLSE